MTELAHRCETCGQSKRTNPTKHNLRPTSSETGPRIHVEVEEDTATEAGIILVRQKQNSWYVGRVLSVAKEAKHVQPGDRVLFVRSVGVPVITAEGACVMIHEHEVLGVIEEAA